MANRPQERIDFIFCLLEQGAGVSKRDFEELARATGQMDLANAWLLSSGAELLEKETFTKALVPRLNLLFLLPFVAELSPTRFALSIWLLAFSTSPPLNQQHASVFARGGGSDGSACLHPA